MYSPFLYILLTNSSFCIFQVIVMMKTFELRCADNEDQAVKFKKHAKEQKKSPVGEAMFHVFTLSLYIVN